MSDTNILREFLVRIGFVTDDRSLKKAEANLAKFTKRVGEFAAAMAAAATAVEAGVVKVAKQFDDLYWASQRLGASVANIQALAFAFTQLGGTKDQAAGALAAVQDYMTVLYGGEARLNALGVATRKANGELRDSAEVLRDLKGRWQAMVAADPRNGFKRAVIDAGVFGINPDQLRVILRDTGKFEAQRNALARKFGVDQDKWAASSKDFMQTLRTAQTSVALIFERVFLNLQKPVSIQIQKFLEWLDINAEPLTMKAIAIGTAFIHFLTAAGTQAGQLVHWLIELDHATGGWSTKVLEAAAAWKLLGIGSLVGGLMELGKALKGLTFGAVATEGAEAAGAVGGLGEVLAAVGAVFAGPVGWILALVAAIGALLLSSEQFRSSFASAMSDTLPGLTEAWNHLKAAWDRLVVASQPLLDALKAIGDGIADALGPLVIGAAKAGIIGLTNLIDGLADSLTVVADILQGKWKQAWRDYQEATKASQLRAMGIAVPTPPANDDGRQRDDAQPAAPGKAPGDKGAAPPRTIRSREAKGTVVGAGLGVAMTAVAKLGAAALAQQPAAANDTGVPDGVPPAIIVGGDEDAATPDTGVHALVSAMRNLKSATLQLRDTLLGRAFGDTAYPTPQPNLVLPDIQTDAGGESRSTGDGRQPKSVRQNNPGNLVDPTTGRIRTFGDALSGAVATAHQLLIDFNRHGQKTIAQLINDPRHGWANEWSPGNSHATAMNYIASLARQLGVGANQQLNLNDPAFLAKLMAAISRVESGRKNAFAADILAKAAEMAVNGRAATSEMAATRLSPPLVHHHHHYAPQQQAAGDVHITQRTEINVQAAGSAHEAVQQVSAAQRSVNSDLVRLARKTAA